METLAVIEVLGRNGETLRRERLFTMPIVIGRGFEADLALDDPYLAARHLLLDADEENSFRLTDLGTLNGFSIPARGNQRQEATVHINAGDSIRLGHTQIRIWRSDSAVAPEILDKSTTDTQGWITFGVWLLMAPGLMSLLTWVDATGPGRYGAVSLEFLTWAAAVLLWSGLWWVASRSAHRMTTFTAHGTVGASTLFITTVSLFTLNTALFVFDLYQSNHGVWSAIVLGACIALGVYRHLRLVSRKSRQAMLSVSLAVAVALIVPLHYTLKQNDLDKIGLMDIPEQLSLPWMRVVTGVSPEEFLN